jgi:DNA-binding transcriptional regulator YdaS (Cro superfamily)
VNLRTYLFNKRISVTEFSKTIGCSRIHLSEIINGRRIPSLMLAKAIERITEGEVTTSELLEEKKEK